MTSPADEIAAAVTKLRAVTEAATPGPWAVAESSAEHGHRVGTADATAWVAWTGLLTEDGAAPDAAYIAAIHPGVGELLAKWLASWQGIDFNEAAALPEDAQHAITIARAINGTAS